MAAHVPELVSESDPRDAQPLAVDPHVRRLAARVVANSRHSAVPYPHRPKVPAELRARYEHEVDPAQELEPDFRRRRALSAWRRDVDLEELRALRGEGEAS